MTDEEPKEEPEGDGTVNWVFWKPDPVMRELDLMLGETLQDGKRMDEERRKRRQGK